MKLTITCIVAVLLSFPASSQDQKPGGCTGCSQQAATAAIPGTHETIAVGRIENVVPIGPLIVLGCEKCAAEVVGWALHQGSSLEDVERAIDTVAAMQKLECFQQQFGPDVVSRMQKPLTAARKALQQARERASM